MAVVCCDTSFLVSFYGRDVHTPRAEAAARKLRGPLSLTALNEFEFGNALQLLVFRKALAPDVAASVSTLFQTDVEEGKIVAAPCNLNATLAEARRMTAHRTARGGHRAFDILHVAAALHLGAAFFLSFDLNQRRLAREEGLKVGP